ncbi:MAG: hypothetical protein RLY21_1098 [Planctomycetota bacterium]|jgi:hypothetical protein
MANWYVNIDGNQAGPYSEADFENMRAQGMIPPNAYVWKEGMPNWVYASELPGGTPAAPPPTSWPAPGVYQQTTPVPSGPSGLVITAYILGGLGLGCGCLTGIPAIICATIAMKQPGQERHAKVALWVSVGCLIVGIVVGVALQVAAMSLEQ